MSDSLALYRANERKLVARIFRACWGNMARAFFPDVKNKFHALELTYALLFVVDGQLQDTPITTARLSRCIGVSPKTAQRWMAELVALGAVVRKGRVFYCTTFCNTPAVQRALDNNINWIITTAGALRQNKQEIKITGQNDRVCLTQQ